MDCSEETRRLVRCSLGIRFMSITTEEFKSVGTFEEAADYPK